uniref:Uncharacterized protein n=1 Tax=viral metagenome TaxID=1070528 RepID=A0A6C0BLI6_9ZZZZ
MSFATNTVTVNASSSSEDILKTLANEYPYINLGRELIIARLHHLIVKLSPDIINIHNAFKAVGCNPLIDFYDSKMSAELGEEGTCEKKYDMIVRSLQLSYMTIQSLDIRDDSMSYPDYYECEHGDMCFVDITLDDVEVSAQDLHTLWHLLTVTPGEVYDSENKFITESVVGALSLDDLLQNIETIEKLRSYPGAIDRVLKHCGDMRNVLNDVVYRYQIMYSPLTSIPNLWTNKISLYSNRTIRIDYRDDDSVDLILHVMNTVLDREYTTEVQMGQSFTGCYFSLGVNNIEMAKSTIAEMNMMRNLSLLSSLSFKN